MLALTIQSAVHATAKNNVRDQNYRHPKAHPQMDIANECANSLFTDIIEGVAGDDQDSEYGENARSTTTIKFRLPPSLHVHGEQSAEDNERNHGGGAMCLEQPWLHGIEFRPEFTFGSMKIVQPGPNQAGKKQGERADIEHQTMTPTKLKPVIPHEIWQELFGSRGYHKQVRE